MEIVPLWLKPLLRNPLGRRWNIPRDSDSREEIKNAPSHKSKKKKEKKPASFFMGRFGKSPALSQPFS
jgi:hypothetical protein